MGGVSPETCWASHKYEIKKNLIHCCILLDFLYELYYDARIHEHQACNIVIVVLYSCDDLCTCTCDGGFTSNGVMFAPFRGKSVTEFKSLNGRKLETHTHRRWVWRSQTRPPSPPLRLGRKVDWKCFWALYACRRTLKWSVNGEVTQIIYNHTAYFRY